MPHGDWEKNLGLRLGVPRRELITPDGVLVSSKFSSPFESRDVGRYTDY